MTADQHALYEELAAGHALSALEPEEEELFLLHLASCARCERELVEHRAIAGQLSYAAPAAAPPASLLESIRAGVAASGREASYPEAPVAVVLPMRRRLRPERPAAWIAAAAALVLVVSLGISNVTLRTDRDMAQSASVRLRAAVTQIENSSAGSRTVQLRAQDGSVNAVALVSNNRVSLVLDGVPRNDVRSSTYVLWRKGHYGGTTPVAVFDIHDGKVDVVRDLPLIDAASVTTLAVTLEHGRSAPAIATAPMIAVGQLA